jgi:hypothetical protein
MPRVPDGRTVLTEPEADNPCNGSVIGERRHLPPFIPDTNPIESTFATVRLRQRVTKGPGSRAAGVAMAFKLIESAQTRWRAVNAPHLVALVRAGAVFKNGKLIERPDESEGGDQQVA